MGGSSISLPSFSKNTTNLDKELFLRNHIHEDSHGKLILAGLHVLHLHASLVKNFVNFSYEPVAHELKREHLDFGTSGLEFLLQVELIGGKEVKISL